MQIRYGGCQCGAARYRLTVDRIVAYACHCRECQKQSASAFAVSLPVPAGNLDVSGPLATFRRPTDSESYTDCWFCESCGTRLYHQSARSPEIVTLKGGTLDDTNGINPVAHLWVLRRQGWLVLPADVPTFETQPDDLKAWRDALVSDNA